MKLLTLQTCFILTLLTISQSSSIPRKPKLCGGGEFRSRLGDCKPCPPGSYRLSASKLNRCERCPSGTFQPSFKASSKLLCRSCYPGTYTSRLASSTCLSCPSGKSSGFGSSSCVSCRPGYEITFKGDAKCIKCSHRTFSDTMNSPLCKVCNYGSKVNGDASKCSKCQKGDACYECPEGMIRGGDGQCKECEMGSEYKGGKCASCKPGFSKGRWDFTCMKCAGGRKHAPSSGAMECLDGNSRCSAGFFKSAQGVCITCPPGHRRNAMTKRCDACSSNEASPGRSHGKCNKCPAGTTPTKDKSGCSCGDGLVLDSKTGKCLQCKAGTYRNDVQHVPDMGCEPCLPGWISSKGSGLCTRCAYGTVSNDAQTKCHTCGVGSVPNVLSVIDMYYEYGQTKCIHATSGKKL